MDQEEQRVLYLSRVGREKIFKYGTYNVVKERTITQDHPFYEIREVSEKIRPDYVNESMSTQASEPAESAAAALSPESQPAAETMDASALASQIISSNFKVGLSQEEVDALLNGMN